jgi:hypothetical protein
MPRFPAPQRLEKYKTKLLPLKSSTTYRNHRENINSGQKIRNPRY